MELTSQRQEMCWFEQNVRNKEVFDSDLLNLYYFFIKTWERCTIKVINERMSFKLFSFWLLFKLTQSYRNNVVSQLGKYEWTVVE